MKRWNGVYCTPLSHEVLELSILWLIPRVQDFVSYGRLGTWAQDSAGTRDGTSGQKIGHASLQWAFSQAAVLLLRQHAAAQKRLARVEKQPGKGKALTGFAHKGARAVYDLLTREMVFELHKVRNSSGSRAAEPAASLDTQGIRLNNRPWHLDQARRHGTRSRTLARFPDPSRVLGHLRWLLDIRRSSDQVDVCCPLYRYS